MLKRALLLSQFQTSLSLQFRSCFTKSHVKNDGPSTQHSFVNVEEIETVGQLLEAVADNLTQKDLFRHGEQDERLTVAEVRKHTNAISNGFLNGRILPNKPLAISLQNNTEHFITKLGANQMGVQLAHMNLQDLTPEKIQKRFDRLQPRSLITDPTFNLTNILEIYEKAIPEIPKNLLLGDILKSRRYPDLKYVLQTKTNENFLGWVPFISTLLYSPLPDPLPSVLEKVKGSDNVEVHFSRFNTTNEEAMCFTQRSLVKSGFGFGSVSSLKERRVCFASDFWQPEVQACALACIAYGSLIIYPTSTFNAPSYIREMERELCDVMVTSPSNLRKLLSAEALGSAKLSLETIIILNNPSDCAEASLISEARDKLKLKQVEVCFIADGAISPFLHSIIQSESPKNLLGYPIPQTEAKIVDDKGGVVGVGKPGKLFTKGSHTTSGFLGVKNSQPVEWLDCGVNAYMDKKGNFFLE